MLVCLRFQLCGRPGLVITKSDVVWIVAVRGFVSFMIRLVVVIVMVGFFVRVDEGGGGIRSVHPLLGTFLSKTHTNVSQQVQIQMHTGTWACAHTHTRT